MLRGAETQWSHLEQRGGSQELLRNAETSWSHIEQRRGDQEVLRGAHIHAHIHLHFKNEWNLRAVSITASRICE